MPKRYTPNDNWSQKAQQEGYRARSVYKLIDLDKGLKLLKPNMSVLDIGAAPGSWLQYIVERIGPKGKAIGIDLQEIEPIAENVHTYVADMLDHDAIDAILEKENIKRVDLVLSDIAPATSGIKDVDQWRSIELGQAVFDLGWNVLPSGGRCVCKIFRGADFDEFFRDLKKNWKNVKTKIADASRDRSKEIYVIGTR